MSTLPDISHNIANDTSDLFQSDSSLHSQALRNKKAALKVQPGHPIYVTSKAIDMHVAKDGKYIWVAESGWVARKWCTAVKSRGGMNKDNETEGCFDAWMIYSTIRSPVLFIEGFSNGLCRGEASTRKYAGCFLRVILGADLNTKNADEPIDRQKPKNIARPYRTSYINHHTIRQ